MIASETGVKCISDKLPCFWLLLISWTARRNPYFARAGIPTAISDNVARNVSLFDALPTSERDARVEKAALWNELVFDLLEG